MPCLNKGECYLPKCVPNICRSNEALLLRKDTFFPERCSHSFECPAKYHCRQFDEQGGFCCFGMGNSEVHNEFTFDMNN